LQVALANSQGNAIQQQYRALVKLSLSDFRCYQSFRLEADRRPVVLIGCNGVGKTNLLEAISFLAPGRGLRRAALGDVTRCDRNATEHGPLWAVAATLETPNGQLEVATGYEMEPDTDAGGRRIVRLNGASVKNQASLDEVCAAIWLVPDMDRLFVDGPSTRRRFLDRMVSTFDISHNAQLNNYEKATRERTRLLREDNSASQFSDVGWIDALEHRMAENGVAIAAARKSYVKKLNAAFQLSTGCFPEARVDIVGDLELWLEKSSALEVEDKFRGALSASRKLDRDAGRALLGAHRSDVEVMYLPKKRQAAVCSTGEQKALLISIILAHARLVSMERGWPPLLLLDEIVAHLDLDKRAALFAEICAIGAQSWMTGTDLNLFEGFLGRAQTFRIDAGKAHSI
tara:strand:+ start:346 stop:1548 length:1203 start_codon:yes stop_codon:yes gene_type:complete